MREPVFSKRVAWLFFIWNAVFLLYSVGVLAFDDNSVGDIVWLVLLAALYTTGVGVMGSDLRAHRRRDQAKRAIELEKYRQNAPDAQI